MAAAIQVERPHANNRCHTSSSYLDPDVVAPGR